MKEYKLNKVLKEFSKNTQAFLDAYSTVTSALQRVGIDIPKLNKKLGVEDASLMELRRLKLGTEPLREVRPNHRYARVPTCDIDAVYARRTSGGGLRRGLRNCATSTRTVFRRCRVKKTKEHIESRNPNSIENSHGVYFETTPAAATADTVFLLLNLNARPPRPCTPRRDDRQPIGDILSPWR